MNPVTQSLGRLGKKVTTAQVLVEKDLQTPLVREVFLKVGLESRLQQVIYDKPPQPVQLQHQVP